MTSNKHMARTAGFVYLLLIITGMYSLMYVPMQLLVRDNPAETLTSITNSLTLYKSGIVIGLLSTLTYLCLALVLYRLLKQVDKQYAIVMVIIVIIAVAFTFAMSLNQITVVSLIEDAQILGSMDTGTLQSQVDFYLNQYSQGVMVAQIFWGLWLLPFGYLVYKSGFLPKFFGILLMLGCVGYVLTFLGDFLIADYGDTLFATIAGLPASIGELGICLWFLIVGAKNSPERMDNQ